MVNAMERDESMPASTLPASTLPVSRPILGLMWLKRFCLAMMAVLLAMWFFGWRFGSPVLVAIFAASLLGMLVTTKLVQFRGTWRIRALLLFTVLAAIAAQFFLLPYRALQRQKSAVQRIIEKGGSVSIVAADQIRLQDHDGWTRTREGWIYPTFWMNWWNKTLGLGYVYELELPASLVNAEFLKDIKLHSTTQLKILLDGANGIDPELFAEMPKVLQYQLHQGQDALSSEAGEHLTDKDMQLLNSLLGDRIYIEALSPAKMQRLENLEKPSVLLAQMGTRADTIGLAKIAEKAIGLDILFINSGRAGEWKPLIDALGSRSKPIELILSHYNEMTLPEWEALAKVRNMRVLAIGDDGLFLEEGGSSRKCTSDDIAKLEMPDLEELRIGHLDRLPSIVQLPKLRSLHVMHIGAYQNSDLKPFLESPVRQIQVDQILGPTTEEPKEESWMDHFQSLRVNGKSLR